MKVQKIAFILVACMASFGSFSQSGVDGNKNNYWEFLRYPDEKSQNHLLIVNYQLMYGAVGKTLGAKGTLATVGINLARFFSKKIIVGLVIDTKTSPGAWKLKPSNAFVSDFNNSFLPANGSPTDSANASVIQNAFNDQNGQNIIGQKLFNYGVALSLFPQKYGGVLLQVKQGTTAFQVNGLYGKFFVKGGGYEKFPLSVSKNWIYELSVKPAAFFGNAYIMSSKKGKNELVKSIVLSVYYERLNFKSAEFNGTKISQMVSADFMSKYGTDNRFGFKIGFGFY